MMSVWDESNHMNTCKVQPFCNGQYIKPQTGKSIIEAKGICTACTDGKYSVILNSKNNLNCKLHGEIAGTTSTITKNGTKYGCGRGQKLTVKTADKSYKEVATNELKCEPCEKGKYRTDDGHFNTSCISFAKSCEKGQKIKGVGGKDPVLFGQEDVNLVKKVNLDDISHYNKECKIKLINVVGKFLKNQIIQQIIIHVKIVQQKHI